MCDKDVSRSLFEKRDRSQENSHTLLLFRTKSSHLPSPSYLSASSHYRSPRQHGMTSRQDSVDGINQDAVRCPICGAAPVVDETCPAACGSLEGLLEDTIQGHDHDTKASSNNSRHTPSLTQRPNRRLFGYSWADGYVAPFVGVTVEAAVQALQAASTTTHDVLVDLGCGDGRVCLAAMRMGATAVGYDLDAALLEQARQQVDRISNEWVTHATPQSSTLPSPPSVTFYQQDLFTVDLESFTIVTVFLLPETLTRLGPRLRAFLRYEASSSNKIQPQRRSVISFGWKIPALGKPTQQADGTDASPDSVQNYSGLTQRWFLYQHNVSDDAEVSNSKEIPSTNIFLL